MSKEETDNKPSNEKSVDISLDMKQVAIAAFATGLVIGVILTGAIFMTTSVSDDIEDNGDQETANYNPQEQTSLNTFGDGSKDISSEIVILNNLEA